MDQIRTTPGCTLLNYSSDPNHNRTVITYIGDAKGVEEASVKLAKKAVELIDLTKHEGEHPRMGCVDVMPFVPIKEATNEECIELSKVVGKRIAEEADLPVFLYEMSAQKPNRKNLAIAPDCELVHMDAVEPCHANGTYEYWFCPECEAVYADEAGTQLTNRMNLTIPADSEAKHVAKVDATCTANGMAEYWYCEECDTFFADAECKYNVAYLSLTIPATGHDFVDGVCTVCGEKAPVADDEDKKPETDKAPVTGDNMMFIVIALAVVLVAGAAIVLFRRKRFN